MAEQVLSTSRLGSVIQLILTGKQTGILKAIRGLGFTQEQGEVHFVNGQPTLASVGQVTGTAALAALLNWGSSQYTFLEGPSLAGQSPQQPDPVRQWNENAVPRTGSLSARPAVEAVSPGPQTSSAPAYTAPLAFHPDIDAGYSGHRKTGTLSYTIGDMSPKPPSAFPVQRATLQESFVPRRLTALDHLEHLPLDRRQRMVLLLVDGRRSLADLARLTQRSDQEILDVLSRLVALGLIE